MGRVGESSLHKDGAPRSDKLGVAKEQKEGLGVRSEFGNRGLARLGLLDQVKGSELCPKFKGKPVKGFKQGGPRDYISTRSFQPLWGA